MPEENKIEDIFAKEGETQPEPAFKPIAPPTPRPLAPPPTVSAEENVAPEEKKPFPVKIILIVIAIVLVVGALGFGAYYYYQHYYLPGKQAQSSGETVTLPVQIGQNTAGTGQDRLTDSDFDGLSDDEEKEYSTDPQMSDTDKDGLTDREEVKVYLTDPRKKDTDGDGFSDGEEVQNFFNPNGSGKLLDLQVEIKKLNNQ